MLLGCGEFAARAGLTDRHVRRMCADGLLRAIRIGSRGTWVIDDRELERPHFVGRRRKAPGWPRGKPRKTLDTITPT